MSKGQCERLIKEYISKCKACDECFAEIFCITNDLRKSREPQSYCVDNIIAYLKLKEQEHE